MVKKVTKVLMSLGGIAASIKESQSKQTLVAHVSLVVTSSKTEKVEKPDTIPDATQPNIEKLTKAQVEVEVKLQTEHINVGTQQKVEKLTEKEPEQSIVEPTVSKTESKDDSKIEKKIETQSEKKAEIVNKEETWKLDEDLVAEVTRLQKEGIKFYRDRKFSVESTKNFPKNEEERAQLAKKDNISLPFYLASSLNDSLADHAKKPKSYPIAHRGLILLIYEHLKGKARANRDDTFVENAHISEGYDGSDSDEDSYNLPLHNKLRVSDEAKEDMKENAGSKQEQGKEVEEEAENEQEKEVEGEEGDEQRKEDVEELEAKDNPYVSDSRNDVQHNMEEGNPRSVDSTLVMENVNSILNAARNSTLEMFNFQKWVIDNISSIQNKQRDLDYKIKKLIKDTNIKGKKDVAEDTSDAEDEE
ncbi:uncharacterized protein LOC131858755 [Cryptomeria japonica]|uniref:uncharacterized protein LOC131858755 n=1 Tax=Cryptomeria japonica TaxID=3369 RepID=UPI0027DA6688|nr:uncharacterized protein LOC131858755 [Cryptomeria japonica]